MRDFTAAWPSLPPGFTLDVPVNVAVEQEAVHVAHSRVGRMTLAEPFGIGLLLRLLHGREVVDADGYFIFPPEVKRVMIDVGAHHCTGPVRTRL